MNTYLVIGECGSGKTWVMKELIKHFGINDKGKMAKINYNIKGDVIILGNYDGTTFEGSDRLSMAVAADFEPFRQWTSGKTIICEGDRFTNQKFIDIFKPTIIRILDDGRLGREFRGSTQSERQLKSIRTRVNKIKAEHEFQTSSEVFQWIKKQIKNER